MIKKPLIFLLLAAILALFAGCASGYAEAPVSSDPIAVPTDPTEAPSASTDLISLGEGATQFYFTAVDGDGSSSSYLISTDESVVGDALLALGLIAGEEGQFGLYVKEVDGIVADYEQNGTYWAFYIDGEYAVSGVDTTAIVAGSTYEFRVEK